MNDQTKINDAQPVDPAADTANTIVGSTYTNADTSYMDTTTKDADTTVLDTTMNEKTMFTDADDSTDGKGVLHKCLYDAEFRHRFMHTAFVWWGFVTLVRINF